MCGSMCCFKKDESTPLACLWNDKAPVKNGFHVKPKEALVTLMVAGVLASPIYYSKCNNLLSISIFVNPLSIGCSVVIAGCFATSLIKLFRAAQENLRNNALDDPYFGDYPPYTHWS